MTKNLQPEFIIEYKSENTNKWEPWNECANFNGKTFRPVFFTKDAANICIKTIKSSGWKNHKFRARKVKIIPLKVK